MRIKYKLLCFICICALTASSIVIGANVSPFSVLGSYIEIARSQLWAMAYQRQISSSLLESKFSDSDTDRAIASQATTARAKERSQSIPYGFPLGWYDSVDYLDTPAIIASEGINAVMPYTGDSSPEKVRAYLERAAAANIKVVIEIPRDDVRGKRTEQVIQFVRELKSHPATYGWYLYDEPKPATITPTALKQIYQAIKAEDPKHTVAIAFNRLFRIPQYFEAFDVAMYDKYPVLYNSPEFSGFYNDTFKKLVDTAVSLTKGKDFWYIVQGYGENKDGTPRNNKRLPTMAEERYMVYCTTLARVDGLFFWAHYVSQQQWIDSVLTPIVEELQNYLPAITQKALDLKLAIDNSAIQAKIYQDPNSQDLLLIAINHSDRTLDTAIAIEEDIKVKSAKIAAKNRSIDLSQKILNDTFKPYAVHIYQLE